MKKGKPSVKTDSLSESYAFEMWALGGIDVNQFDSFIANRSGPLKGRSKAATELRYELHSLRYESERAYGENNIDLAVANAKAMRWLSEYAVYRYSVHDKAHKGQKIVSTHATNLTRANEERSARANDYVSNKFNAWQSRNKLQLVDSGEPLSVDELAKKFKKTLEWKSLPVRKKNRFNALLKEGKLSPQKK